MSKTKIDQSKNNFKALGGQSDFFLDFFVSLGAFAVFFVPLYVDFN